MKRHHVIVPLMGLLLTASSAFAQDKGHFGLVAGFPTSVAVIWHVAEPFAIRPEFSFSHTSSTTTISVPPLPATTTTSKMDLVSFAVSGLIYGKAVDHLRTYVAPAFTYARGTSSTTTTAGVTTPGLTLPTYGVRATVGAQYELMHCFSMYGEVGAAFTHGTTTSSGTTGSSNGWNIRSAVGGILYLNAKK